MSATVLLDNVLDVCRVCLCSGRDVCGLLELPPGCEGPTDGTITVASLITLLGDVPVSGSDGLPPQICVDCLEVLITFYKFRSRLQQNYELLNTYIKNTQHSTTLLPISNGANTELGFKDDEMIVKDEDDIILSNFKNEDFNNDYDSLNEEEFNELEKSKSKKKKSKKSSSKRIKKKSNSKIKNDTKKVRMKVATSNSDSKTHDKLSAALQKRVENRDKCPLCFEKLRENETMSEHFYTHYKNSNLTPLIVNGEKTTQCNLCDKSYKFNSMIPHHRKHLKLYPFKCEIEGCDKAFASTINLGWHLDNHNGVKKYQCQVCGKTFHLSGSLRNHEETHIIEKAQCKICHKTYKNHIMLKLHMKRHIYGQRHKCEAPGCDKAFYSAQELRKHAHVHYSSKTFICDVCSKPWYTEKELVRHKKYHDPVKQHQCSECMKTFVDKSQLRCHEMTHRGERPHVCEYCNMGFITKSKLKRHQIKSCKGAKHIQIL